MNSIYIFCVCVLYSINVLYSNTFSFVLYYIDILSVAWLSKIFQGHYTPTEHAQFIISFVFISLSKSYKFEEHDW